MRGVLTESMLSFSAEVSYATSELMAVRVSYYRLNDARSESDAVLLSKHSILAGSDTS